MRQSDWFAEGYSQPYQTQELMESLTYTAAIKAKQEFLAEGFVVENVSNPTINRYWFDNKIVNGELWIKLNVDFNLFIKSDKPLMGSPVLTPVVTALIRTIIVTVGLLIITYFVAMAIIDWWKEFTVDTKKSTITKQTVAIDPNTGEIIRDAEGNPVILTETTENLETGGDPLNMIILIIGAVAILFIVLAFRSGGTTVNIMGKKAGFKAG